MKDGRYNQELWLWRTKMADLGWTSRALARLLGIQPQTLNYWILGGLVNPLNTGIGRPGHNIGLDGLLEAMAADR